MLKGQRPREGYLNEFEKKDIYHVRKNFGLRPLKRGVVNCLRCDNKFKSNDKVNNRLCHPCRHRQSDGIDQE